MTVVDRPAAASPDDAVLQVVDEQPTAAIVLYRKAQQLYPSLPFAALQQALFALVERHEVSIDRNLRVHRAAHGRA